jgi:hypothetical protein
MVKKLLKKYNYAPEATDDAVATRVGPREL